MGGFESFFKESAESSGTVKHVISERFRNKDGEPEKWELRSISAAYDRALRAMEPKDTESYLARLAAACVVYPNLNDAQLQGSYGVMGADRVLREMLLKTFFRGRYVSCMPPECRVFSGIRQ